MILRPATPDDAAALAELGRASFCAAFEHLYVPEDLAGFLGEVHSPAAIAADIVDPALLHRLAEDTPGSGLTGFAKLRAPTSYRQHSDAANPIELCQLYTHPARTGEGIGAALIEWALGHARAQGHDAVQLSVYSDNPGAQRFYQRYGFGKIADIHFRVGRQLDHEYLYELRL